MVNLVIRNPTNGQVVFSSATITVHIRGSFVSTLQAGSITIPGLSAIGAPFVLSAIPVNTEVSEFPTFTINGDTVSWPASLVPCRVIMASRC